VSFSVNAGEVCAVLGPNGAGKSTIVRVLSGALRPERGKVRLFGEDLEGLSRQAIARRVAVVPQVAPPALGFSVHEVVMMGRAPHQGAWMRASEGDEEAVLRAIEACDLGGLRDRLVAELSGGEQKRAAIARALAQEGKVLILDEASAHLDVRHSIAIHEVVRKEVEDRGLACLAILHDLNVAAQYADKVVLLKGGRLVAAGSVEEVMTYARLKDVFESELYVGVNELDNARYFLPVRPEARRAPAAVAPGTTVGGGAHTRGGEGEGGGSAENR
jgi:iron complex transport system ATP-binding protein